MSAAAKKVIELCETAIKGWRDAIRWPPHPGAVERGLSGIRVSALTTLRLTAHRIIHDCVEIRWPTWSALKLWQAANAALDRGYVRFDSVPDEEDLKITALVDDFEVWLIDLEHVGLARKPKADGRGKHLRGPGNALVIELVVHDLIKQGKWNVKQQEIAAMADVDPRDLRRGQGKVIWDRYVKESRRAAAETGLDAGKRVLITKMTPADEAIASEEADIENRRGVRSRKKR
jgi:hypothetical protein